MSEIRNAGVRFASPEIVRRVHAQLIKRYAKTFKRLAQSEPAQKEAP